MNIHELRLNDDAERQERYATLARVIRDHGVEAGVAVGVRFGGQAEVILDQTEVGELLGVEAYEPPADPAASGDSKAFTAPQWENLFWYTMGRLSRFDARYGHVRGSSPQAAQRLNLELDFVLLDAANAADLSLWFPKVRGGGGVIGGHGYGLEDSPIIKPAVDEFFADPARALPVHVEAGGVWWVAKHV